MYQSAIIIDDSPLERYIVEKIIKISRFAEDVKGFNTGDEALEWLQALQQKAAPAPEVIFVDIQMPVMTGFDFLDQYMQLPEELRRQSKIVMISSTLAVEDHVRMKKYPIITRFLPKPINEEMIRGLVL